MKKIIAVAVTILVIAIGAFLLQEQSNPSRTSSPESMKLIVPNGDVKVPQTSNEVRVAIDASF